MDSGYTVRLLTDEDEPTLSIMLMHAAHESSVAAVKTNLDLSRYVVGWGRYGDVGVVAEIEGAAVGAAWLRLWSEGDHGYGYLDDQTPELAIAVVPEARGRGIGTALLNQLLAIAQSQLSTICLSIRADNPALRLYERLGFVRVAGTEVTNRAGSVSFTMLCKLDSRPSLWTRSA